MILKEIPGDNLAYGLISEGKLIKDNQALANEEVKILLDISLGNDNIWQVEEKFILFKLKDLGYYGYFHFHPDGYSSVTFDPGIKFYVHTYTNLEQFINLALDSDLRNLNSVHYLIRR